MKTPLVSVLVAAYKTNAKHLRECIESILNQTYTNFELLILDDCPEDINVKKVVESYKDSRIFYRQNKNNLGIAQTRNNLMEWAKGKYLAVMDHDDIMLPNRLEEQVCYMEVHPEIGICGSAYRRFGDFKKRGIILPLIESDEIKAGLFFKCTMHHPSVLIRKDVILKYHIKYNTNYVSANDRHLYLDAMPYTEMHNLDKVLMIYRMHADMTSKQKRSQILDEQEKLRNEMLSSIGIKLDSNELDILNNYVLKGRSRIKKTETLLSVEQVLTKINQANKKTCYFPVSAFEKMCAKYLIRRCLNAAVYGRISSKELLKKTELPVNQCHIPCLLKISNFILFKKEKEKQ